jgi:hypothetical protein
MQRQKPCKDKLFSLADLRMRICADKAKLNNKN